MLYFCHLNWSFFLFNIYTNYKIYHLDPLQTLNSHISVFLAYWSHLSIHGSQNNLMVPGLKWLKLKHNSIRLHHTLLSISMLYNGGLTGLASGGVLSPSPSDWLYRMFITLNMCTQVNKLFTSSKRSLPFVLHPLIHSANCSTERTYLPETYFFCEFWGLYDTISDLGKHFVAF